MSVESQDSQASRYGNCVELLRVIFVNPGRRSPAMPRSWLLQLAVLPKYPQMLTCRLSASSFGDPTAQPPTPKRTPTSAVFPSPVFTTPKQNHSHFDESSGWTPRFAEEYSVFNSTPGNLRSSQGTFLDFAAVTPFPPTTGKKRPLSAEGLPLSASHANHFTSHHGDLSLPTDDSTARLPSSSDPLNPTHEEAEPSTPTGHQKKSTKKSRKSIAAKEKPGQTATPPPSSKKGRKLAPKLKTDNMQNDEGYGQLDYTDASQQLQLANFVPQHSGDGFDYPLSAPATAPADMGDRSFWGSGMDTNMVGMNMGFPVSGADMFATHHNPSHGHSVSLDWGSNQVFQDMGMITQQHQQNQENGLIHRQDGLPGPKDEVPNTQLTSPSQAFFAGSYQPPSTLEDPFGIHNGGGVDPGILYSRPSSSNMETSAMDTTPINQPNFSGAAARTGNMEQENSASRALIGGNTRRPATAGQVGQKKKLGRPSKISPSKGVGRVLPRSFSEDQGKRPMSQQSLPPLLPAARPMARQDNVSPTKSSGSYSQQSTRPNERISPLKSHHRLSSLTSIPESTSSRFRTSVKFVIDKNGRARTEIVDEEPPPPPPPSSGHRRQKTQPLHKASWDSSDEDSSTDDEPIIIPSRVSSFSLPDPRGSSLKQPSLYMSQGSFTDRTGGYPQHLEESPEKDMDSEAETVVMNELGAKVEGAAEGALRKAMEDRQARAKQPKSGSSSGHRQRFMYENGGFGGPSYQRGSSTISPMSRTDVSHSTPLSMMNRGRINCVCNRHEVEVDGDDFLVEW